MMEPPIILIMGVCGTGKTTIGHLLAERIGGTFIDADDLHPSNNIKKMKDGIPLTDADRLPWLDDLALEICDHKGTGAVVVACSALKKAYRQRIGADAGHLVYLKGERADIVSRLRARNGHFMREELLSSQLIDLEEPVDALTISILNRPEDIVRKIVDTLIL